MEIAKLLKQLAENLQRPTSILPLVGLRLGFGLLMFLSTIRFIWMGWVDTLYIAPPFHFTYLGFGWIKPLPGISMYCVFGVLLLLSLCIFFGFAYRFSMSLFFLLFTYVELVDKAAYLNHYYFISLLSLLMIFLPLNRRFAVDSWRNPNLRTDTVPQWTVVVLRLQLGIVYFFAGFAKLTPDWMLHGMPMGIWLKANTHFPLIGWLFDYHWFAWLMSWAGAFYDLTIPFWLLWRRTRPLAYFTVIVFHLMTALLFPIGMFPYIMMMATLIFFTGADYAALLKRFGLQLESYSWKIQTPSRALILFILLFFAYQFFMPLRHYLYEGDTNWTMEGYDFAWRVMLNEKTGFVIFTLANPKTGQSWQVYPDEYLTDQQVRVMSFQPDMILQFAHYLDEQYPADLAVYAQAYVAHNGRSSRLLLDPQTDLSRYKRSIWHWELILPAE
jgi:hypothetical protein